MYLKNIEVFGFKSFAQKINFEFPKGITGIVGPNGSGKSNVADAVRWVLGEQSAKQLRGGNMQDVIFAGTEARKPLSYASVAITLDNSDKKLPIDFEEVTVTRKLYRSGESEYMINGTSCRLRDIHEMFYDTGIGKEGYSIIGQGQIDKILSGKPDDRRELFDEAAGIVKFKRRKNATLKKLEEEQSNLVRITDILSELERQLGPLERQAEKAKIYLAKRDIQKELDVNVFLLDSEHLQKELSEAEEKFGIADEEFQIVREKLEKIRAEYAELEQKQEELETDIDSRRETVSQMTLEKQQVENQMELLKEQIQSAIENMTVYQNRLAVIKQELKTRSESLLSYEEEESVLRKQLKDSRKELSELQEQLSFVNQSRDEAAQAIESAQNEVIELLNTRADLTGNTKKFQTMKEQTDIRRSEITQRHLSLKTQEMGLNRDLDKNKEDEKGCSQNYNALQDEENDLNAKIQELQKQIREDNEKLEAERSLYHRDSSRLEAIRNMTERYDGYGNSIRKVMEQKKQVSGIHGVVADLIQVDKNYEVAIETALGGSIQNIVTEDENTAKKMIEYLKRNRLGRATFLPLTAMKGKGDFPQKDALKEPGVIGTASSLVKTKSVYDGMIQQLLGRILVVDHIDHAIAIAKKYRYSIRIVTCEGELLNAGGSMTGGAFKNNSNLLGRRREMEELEEKLKTRNVSIDQLQKKIDSNRNKRHLYQDSVQDIREKIQKLEIFRNTLSMQKRQLEEKLNDLQKEYKSLRVEQDELNAEVKKLENQDQEIKEKMDESARDEQEINRFIEKQQKDVKEYEEQSAELTQKIETVRLKVSALEQKEVFQNENRARIQSESENLSREQTEIQDKISSGNDNKKEKESAVAEKQDRIKELEEQLQTQKTTLSGLSDERDVVHKKYKKALHDREEFSTRESDLDKECFRLKSQIDKLTETKEQQINYLWEEYELTPNHAAKLRNEELKDRAALKKELADVKNQIKQLGSVNVNAIEDFKEASERHTFLAAQYHDLVEAEATLKNIIQKLDDGMRKQFAEKFQQIQKEYDIVFKELFGGGKGTLKLAEDEDILQAGIEIISQPPGKKLQNMMQLSGGEKALSAIALLFAIQNLKPSPFCLLDEIEAALDDSNVGRFAGYLSKLTDETQFIVITHRRGTMNAADRLYGITMQEKGVSTLVSVDLVENSITK